MKRVEILIIFLVIFAISLTFAEEIDWKNTPMSAAYVETTNGVFSVCGFDRKNKILYRFKGITVAKTNLPEFGSFRHPMIFAQGEKPEINRETHYTKDGDIILGHTKKVHPELYYRYGKIPYEIKDVDPPLYIRRTEENEVAVGVRLYSRFYAVTNIGEIANGKFTYKIDGREMHLLTADTVIPVETPEHRKKEIKEFAEELENVLKDEQP